AGFPVVAGATFEIAGGRPIVFVSRGQSGSLATPGQTDAWHGRGMQGRLGSRIGRQSCASWSLGPLRGELADEQEEAFAAAGTNPLIVRRSRVGRMDRRRPRRSGRE